MAIDAGNFATDGTRVQALDGIRGFAVLAVLCFHGGAPLAGGGFIGVDLFFVLSGFLITSILLAEHARTGRISLRNFYFRRLLRLGPALLLLLVVYLVGSLIWARSPHRNVVDVLIVLGYATNWARAFNWHPPLDLGHTWSLSIEEQFYLTWPFLFCVMLRRLRREQILAITLLLAATSWLTRVGLTLVGATPLRVYSGLDSHSDGLLIGCALALIIARGSMPVVAEMWLKRLVAGLPIAVGFLLLASVFSSWHGRLMVNVGFLFVNLAVASVIATAVCGPSRNRFASAVLACLSFRPLAWVGTISYGIYLWHYPIFRLLKGVGFGRFSTLALGTALTFAIAIASFYVIERPALRFKKLFEFSRQKASTQDPLNQAKLATVGSESA